jgi:hypothetical protein
MKDVYIFKFESNMISGKPCGPQFLLKYFHIGIKLEYKNVIQHIWCTSTCIIFYNTKGKERDFHITWQIGVLDSSLE